MKTYLQSEKFPHVQSPAEHVSPTTDEASETETKILPIGAQVPVDAVIEGNFERAHLPGLVAENEDLRLPVFGRNRAQGLGAEFWSKLEELDLDVLPDQLFQGGIHERGLSVGPREDGDSSELVEKLSREFCEKEVSGNPEQMVRICQFILLCRKLRVQKQIHHFIGR